MVTIKATPQNDSSSLPIPIASARASNTKRTRSNKEWFFRSTARSNHNLLFTRGPNTKFSWTILSSSQFHFKIKFICSCCTRNKPVTVAIVEWSMCRMKESPKSACWTYLLDRRPKTEPCACLSEITTTRVSVIEAKQRETIRWNARCWSRRC